MELYLSDIDFEIFIKESKLEDFIFQHGETINVSTIHKAKGKEFDNVFLMLDHFDANSDNSKRQLYVAMTRAKRNLTIHYNGSFLNNIEVEELTHIKNMGIHPLPKHLMYLLILST
jgi:ATP-dependent DNA helicase RecQ